MKKAAHKKDGLELLFIYLVVVVSLCLTATNIATYLSPRLVLGIEAESEANDIDSQYAIYWESFLTANPEYIPGWLETGRHDIARQIDPNFDF
jgi:hypothetical protein